MNILLYPNLKKDNCLTCVSRMIEKLHELGATPMLDDTYRNTFNKADCVYGKFSELLCDCDVIVPVGGDGTIMRAARYAVDYDKPVMGINAGRLGFLSELEYDELDRLELLVKGRYTVYRRMMLEAELERESKRYRVRGINDIVVSRMDGGRLVDFIVFQDDQMIARHRADGLILATPTGSTAYSLSAGGPIVDPNMTLLLMTAICSHSTCDRSLVLPSDREYVVMCEAKKADRGMFVSVDGRKVGALGGGDRLIIREAASRVSFIDLGLRNFFENVNEKLSWGRQGR